MKLSDNTVTILKNFSTINQSIQFRKGDVLTTIAPSNAILGEAKLAESLPRDFAIYDLPKFLAAHDLIDNPDFTFKDNHVVMSAGKRHVSVVYADPSAVKSFNKKVQMPKAELVVDLNEKDWSSLKKAASVLGVPHLTISGNGKSIVFTVLDNKNTALGNFTVESEQETDKTFELVLHFDNLKIVDGTYKIYISTEIVNLKHVSGTLQYWVAAEANSGI